MVLGRKVRNLVLIFVLSNLCMIGIVAACYLIPNEALRNNVAKSYSILQNEGVYFQFIDWDLIYVYDNFTDAYIVSTVFVQPEENVFRAALENNVSKLGIHEYDAMNGLAELLQDESQYAPYLNYWSWIAPLLKVPFLLWNIGEIRLLMFTFGLCMAGIVFCKLKTVNFPAAVGLASALVSGGCLINIMCLAYCTDIILMYTGMLIILALYEKNKAFLFHNESYIFFILGMLGFMLNYWSMPTIVLCGPLTVLLLLKIKENSKAGYLGNIIRDAACWGLGFGAEIALRLGTAYVMTGQGGVINHLSLYVTGERRWEEGAGIRLRIETIYYSVAKYFTEINKYIFVATVTFLLIYLCRKMKLRNILKRFHYIAILDFGVIAAIPLVWIGVLCGHTNHSFDILQICMSSFAFTGALAVQMETGEGGGYEI